MRAETFDDAEPTVPEITLPPPPPVPQELVALAKIAKKVRAPAVPRPTGPALRVLEGGKSKQSSKTVRASKKPEARTPVAVPTPARPLPRVNTRTRRKKSRATPPPLPADVKRIAKKQRRTSPPPLPRPKAKKKARSKAAAWKKPARNAKQRDSLRVMPLLRVDDSSFHPASAAAALVAPTPRDKPEPAAKRAAPQKRAAAPKRANNVRHLPPRTDQTRPIPLCAVAPDEIAIPLTAAALTAAPARAVAPNPVVERIVEREAAALARPPTMEVLLASPSPFYREDDDDLLEPYRFSPLKALWSAMTGS